MSVVLPAEQAPPACGADATLAALEQALAAASASGRPLGVVLIEVQRLDRVRLLHGWRTAEQVLFELGARLQRLARADDPVMRPGEAHYALLLTGLRTAAQARLAATKVARELAEPLSIDGALLRPLVRQGVVVTVGESDGRRLLQRAHAALSRARANGEALAVFDGASDVGEAAEVGGWQLANELEPALQRGEFELWYQPKLCLADRSVAGAEALVRWNHPRHGLLGPNAFVPQAEQDGHVHLLTWSVLNMALRRLSDWPEDLPASGIAVNVSPLCLNEADFAGRVLEAVSLWGVPPALLTLEITESAVMRDTAASDRALRTLRAAGVSVSIDDFGTGFSSLGHFRHLPADELKIDRCFVSRLASDEGNRHIVGTVLHLSRCFGFRTVAEGIEDADTLERLAGMGCDVGQGYHIARPMPVPQWLQWLRAHGALQAR